MKVDASVDALLRDAQVWHLMGRLLERPRPAWRDDVRRLADHVTDEELREAAMLAQDASEGNYLSAFGPAGAVSPREVAHQGMRDPGQLLAELKACYDAFGYRPQVEDTIDHVAVEVDFVGYLYLKEAFARSQGDIEHAEVTAEASNKFVEEHLREMGEPIAGRLGPVAEPYLAMAARALARRAGKATPSVDHKVVWLKDEDSMECGDAPD